VGVRGGLRKNVQSFFFPGLFKIAVQRSKVSHFEDKTGGEDYCIIREQVVLSHEPIRYLKNFIVRRENVKLVEEVLWFLGEDYFSYLTPLFDCKRGNSSFEGDVVKKELTENYVVDYIFLLKASPFTARM